MKNQRIVVAITTAVVALSLIGASAMAGGKEHTLKVGKKGEVTFDKETKVGDLTLKPGRYFFQHRVEGEDHFVHFTEVTKGSPVSYTGGGVPKAHPGEVKCRLEALPAKASQTRVFLSDEGAGPRVTRIEVGGENAVHLF